MNAGAIIFEEVFDGVELPRLTIDVSATTVVLGAIAARDWQPQHHEKDFAQQRNGMQDIFINTPHNAAYFERYITDWTGSRGRLAGLKFQMIDSVYPGDQMVFNGSVNKTCKDQQGCGWLGLSLWLTVADKITTRCSAKVAVPSSDLSNPWLIKGEDWDPTAIDK